MTLGAWNYSPFGNDAALDWVGELLKSADGVAFIRHTLRAFESDDEDSSPVCEEAIAASSAVSAAAVDPVGRTNADVKSWINTHAFVPDQELLQLADSVISSICSDSELRELWQESEGLDPWLRQTQKLVSNFRIAQDRGLPERKPKKRGMPRTLAGLVKRYAEEPSEKIRKKISAAILKLPDPNAVSRGSDYVAPLTLVASYGLLDETRLLIQRGADIGGDTPSNRPFDSACVGDHLEVAKLIYDSGAKIFSQVSRDRTQHVETRDHETSPLVDSYCSALFSVARFGTPRMANYLIELGADLRQTDLNGETLLHKASEGGNLEMLRFLTDSGLEINQTKDGLFEEAPLHYAVQAEQLEAVRVLLELGAEPNLTVEYAGSEGEVCETPMNYTENVDIQKLLLQFGGKLGDELAAKKKISDTDSQPNISD